MMPHSAEDHYNHFVEFRFVDCRSTECQYIGCHFAEYHSVECHFADFYPAECHFDNRHFTFRRV